MFSITFNAFVQAVSYWFINCVKVYFLNVGICVIDFDFRKENDVSVFVCSDILAVMFQLRSETHCL